MRYRISSSPRPRGAVRSLPTLIEVETELREGIELCHGPCSWLSGDHTPQPLLVPTLVCLLPLQPASSVLLRDASAGVRQTRVQGPILLRMSSVSFGKFFTSLVLSFLIRQWGL